MIVEPCIRRDFSDIKFVGKTSLRSFPDIFSLLFQRVQRINFREKIVDGLKKMTKEQPLVSIIVNNYNYAQFLSQAIDSVLDQTYLRVEVILVDDCSTDQSHEIIFGYGDHIKPIFHADNGKQGAAFNSGFAQSQGDIVLFLDADDYLYPYAIERIVRAWKPELSKVHYRLAVVDSEGNSRGFSYPQGNSLASDNVSQSVIEVGTYIGVPTSGNAISRRALEKVMPIPAEFNTVSDDYLSVLIPLYGEVAAIEECLGSYRIHTSNQWAMSEVSSDRFHRFIRHDLRRCELIRQYGTELGYDVPNDLYMRFFGRAWSRLASLKLDPQQHPVQDDRAAVLAYQGIRSLWSYSKYNWQKRTIFSLWFIWVSTTPRWLASPAISWLFAPQTRPQFVAKTLSKLKAILTPKPPAQTG